MSDKINSKMVVLMLLIASIIVGSASIGEKTGNPHIDDGCSNITVEYVLYDTEPNCSNVTPLIIEGETIITRDLIENFFCENGFVLFSERSYPTELVQTWLTPGGEFVRVGLYEDSNGFPRLRIYDQVKFELSINEVVLS